MAISNFLTQQYIQQITLISAENHNYIIENKRLNSLQYAGQANDMN